MTTGRGDDPVPILMYHHVSSSPVTGSVDNVVPLGLFRDQMTYLRDEGYTALTVSDLVARRANADLPGKPVVLTFDDAATDFHDKALPILAQLGLTATLYVPTGLVDRSRAVMGWAQIREARDAGIECGAHTHTHAQLDRVSAAAARAEIGTSKRLLEQHLGRPVETFAYPGGYVTPPVRRMVRDAGFRSACAVRYAISPGGDDPYALSRLVVSARMAPQQFARLLTPAGAARLMAWRVARSRAWHVYRRFASASRPAAATPSRRTS